MTTPFFLISTAPFSPTLIQNLSPCKIKPFASGYSQSSNTGGESAPPLRTVTHAFLSGWRMISFSLRGGGVGEGAGVPVEPGEGWGREAPAACGRMGAASARADVARGTSGVFIGMGVAISTAAVEGAGAGVGAKRLAACGCFFAPGCSRKPRRWALTTRYMTNIANVMTAPAIAARMSIGLVADFSRRRNAGRAWGALARYW